jgi:pyridoxamine 5'-phosphate oxidase
VSGDVVPVDDAEADAYFATRPHGSQLGAWASRQSEPLEDRTTLELAVARVAERFGDGPIPRPPFWGGFRVVPSRIELWQDEPDRLHSRWEHLATPDGWTVRMLWP